MAQGNLFPHPPSGKAIFKRQITFSPFNQLPVLLYIKDGDGGILL